MNAFLSNPSSADPAGAAPFMEVAGPAADPVLQRELLAARFPALVGAPGDAEERLWQARVLVAGCGAVGRPAAQALARLGIGELGLIDPKSYRPVNLPTQPMRPAEVARPKAEVTARECKGISPRTRVRFTVGLFEQLSPADLAGFDVVVMATDNLVVEAQVGQACLHFGIPLIHAAVHGATMVAQVRVYRNLAADSVTPACGFSDHELELMAGEAQFACGGPAADAAEPAIAGPPTRSFAALSALAASLTVTQLLRLVLGLGEPVADTQLEFCAFTNRAVVSPLPRRRACSCDHTRYRVVRAPRQLAECSLGELAALGGCSAAVAVPEFTVSHFSWAESGMCTCGRRGKVHRFVAPGETHAGACRRCGKPLHVQPFFIRRPVGAAHVARHLHLPLGELGARGADWALVRDGQAAVFFLNP